MDTKRAFMVIKIDMGETDVLSVNTLDDRIQEVLGHLPLESITKLDFEVDGKNLPVNINVVLEGEDEVSMSEDFEVIVGDEDMMEAPDGLGFKAEYANEEDLLNDLKKVKGAI